MSDWSSDVCFSELGLLADLQHLFADLVDRLIPADLLVFAVDQLHRVLQAPLAMRVPADRSALGAMRTEVQRAVEAGLLTDPDAVLHLRHDRAADGAARKSVGYGKGVPVRVH